MRFKALLKLCLKIRSFKNNSLARRDGISLQFTLEGRYLSLQFGDCFCFFGCLFWQVGELSKNFFNSLCWKWHALRILSPFRHWHGYLANFCLYYVATYSRAEAIELTR